MTRTSRIVVAGVVVALALVTVAYAPTARAAMDLPVWTSGDYWLYSLSGVSGAGIPGLEGTGTMRVDVVGVETITIGGTSISTYHARVNMTISTTISGQTFTFSFLGDQWYRVSDLAQAKMSIGASILGQTFSVSLTYNPPMEIRWPLTANASWPTTSTLTATVNIFGQTNTTSETVTLQHTVEADRSVTVTAGTFSTTPVKDTTGSTGYTRSHWSATVGNWVSQKTYDDLGTEQGSMDLTSYTYQGPGLLGALFLGLSLLIWLVLLAFVVIVIVAVLVLRRKKPPVPAYLPVQPVPPTQPPMQQGPPGYPPSPPPGTGP